LLQFGTDGGLTARSLFVDDTAPSLLKRSALQVEMLVLRGDPRIADALIH